jgi:hypothetical protein
LDFGFEITYLKGVEMDIHFYKHFVIDYFAAKDEIQSLPNSFPRLVLYTTETIIIINTNYGFRHLNTTKAIMKQKLHKTKEQNRVFMNRISCETNYFCSLKNYKVPSKYHRKFLQVHDEIYGLKTIVKNHRRKASKLKTQIKDQRHPRSQFRYQRHEHENKGKKQIDILGYWKLLNKWREKKFHNKKGSETCITDFGFPSDTNHKKSKSDENSESCMIYNCRPPHPNTQTCITSHRSVCILHSPQGTTKSTHCSEKAAVFLFFKDSSELL